MSVKVQDSNPHKERKSKLKEALKGLSYQESFRLLFEFEKELTTDLMSKTTI
jgi:hypothetical protein